MEFGNNKGGVVSAASCVRMLTEWPLVVGTNSEFPFRDDSEI